VIKVLKTTRPAQKNAQRKENESARKKGKSPSVKELAPWAKKNKKRLEVYRSIF
jgi:hypothetical protein